MVKSANKIFLGCFFLLLSLCLCPNKFMSILVHQTHTHTHTKSLSAVGFSLCCNSLAFVTEVLIMEIQFLELSVTSFTSLLNLKLAATTALQRAMTGHPDGWDDKWKDTLSFIYLPAHSRAAPLAESLAPVFKCLHLNVQNVTLARGRLRQEAESFSLTQEK